jgi:hypothetical protein
VPLPPEPVLRRWGAWIEATNYYISTDYFDDLKIILQKLEDTTVEEQESVKSDLTFIQSHFFILVKNIKNLEHSSLNLYVSTPKVNNVILAMEKVFNWKKCLIPNYKADNNNFVREKKQYHASKCNSFYVFMCEVCTDNFGGCRKVF